jgi:transposase
MKKVPARAKEKSLRWPLQTDLSDGDSEKILFPDLGGTPTSSRRPPDLAYHKEIAKSGVTVRLLWSEYCTTCLLANERPLIYSQFCHYCQKYAEKKRATMHIPPT